LGKSSERYIEIYPFNEILTKFTAEGVYYEKLKTRILPCPAIEGDGMVIQRSLSEIPLLPEPQILEGLRKALASFGTVIDVGL
ncbi:uncharacterized protein EV154DRAFT_402356, partial [Mucor mucedo]|uniref:uncharacterized protein n=1 Tax=Mucor mucedo TaxID=29922 RepID=UPI002220C131